MDRRRFSLLALVSLLPGFAHAQTAPAELGADAIAARVQAFYDQAQTFNAEFKQRYTIYAYNKTKDSAGAVIFSKPGKMRWTYSNNGNVVVSDGKQIKIYEKDNRQMFLQKVDNTQYPAALAFLMGNGSLDKSFVLSKLDAEQLEFRGGYVLLGTPKDPTPAYQKVLLYVDAKTFQVRRVLLIDAQKNRNRFDFINARVNEKVKEDVFRFTPPPGTNTIKP